MYACTEAGWNCTVQIIPVVWHCLLSCCQTKATDLSSTWEQFPGWRRSRSTCWRTLSCCVRLTHQSCTSRNWPSTSSTFSREWQWMQSLKPINLTLSLPAVHAKYTPGNQLCRNALQLGTSCAGVLHCRSLPACFKTAVSSHSSTPVYPYISIKTIEWSAKFWGGGGGIMRLKSDFLAHRDDPMTKC